MRLERAAHWAAIWQCIFAAPCLFVAILSYRLQLQSTAKTGGDGIQSGGWIAMIAPHALPLAIGIMTTLVVISAVLNYLASRRPHISVEELNRRLTEQREAIERQIPSISVNGTSLSAPFATKADKPRGASTPQYLRGQIAALAGDLCGYLIELRKDIKPPHDSSLTGLESIPDEPEIVGAFEQRFGSRLLVIKNALGGLGMLLGNIGQVMEDGAHNADDVRRIIERLNDGIDLLDHRCGTKVIPDNYLAPASSVFSKLQNEAFKLAKELRGLFEECSWGQSTEQFHRMRLEYEQKFAPKVKELMFEFAREQGGEDSTLRRHIQFIDNGNDVLNVANALIRLAHIQDGIDVSLRYPS